MSYRTAASTGKGGRPARSRSPVCLPAAPTCKVLRITRPCRTTHSAPTMERCARQHTSRSGSPAPRNTDMGLARPPSVQALRRTDYRRSGRPDRLDISGYRSSPKRRSLAPGARESAIQTYSQPLGRPDKRVHRLAASVCHPALRDDMAVPRELNRRNIGFNAEIGIVSRIRQPDKSFALFGRNRLKQQGRRRFEIGACPG